MRESYDIIGIGCATVDDLLYVDSFPIADDKTPVVRRERQCGGLTATALVAASRLGAKAAFAGVLGHDDLSRYVVERLTRENIDLQHVTFLPDARPIHSTIIVGAEHQSRNIFFEINGLSGPADDRPDTDVIRSAKVLFLDHLNPHGGIRACKIAREAGIPIVADFEQSDGPGFETLMSLVDHLILSRDFALRLTQTNSASNAVNKLWTEMRKAVVVTSGKLGCWYRSSDSPKLTHFPAFDVDSVDSTGCGDVFHGAYAASLARNESAADRIAFASAAAAIKATQAGGQAGIPTRTNVEAFLKENT